MRPARVYANRDDLQQPAPASAAWETVARGVPVAGAPASRTGTGISDSYDPASFGARLGARVIDGAILTLIGIVPVFVVLRVAISTHNDVLTASGGLLAALLVLELVPVAAYLVYRLGSDGGSGRSVGRAALGIRLVTLPPADIAHPNRVGYWRAFGRLIVGGLTDWLFFLGSLSMLWNPQKRTWADLAAGTAVVRDNTQRPGPGRALTAAVAVTAVITAGAAITGIRERDNLDRQLTAASLNTYGNTGTGGGSTVDPGAGSSSSGDTGTDPGTVPTPDPSPADTTPAPEPTDSTTTGSVAAPQTATVNGGGSQVNLRQGPGSTEYASVGQVDDQSSVTVTCGVYGGPVDGDGLWLYTGQGWIADALLTGIDTSSIAACDGSIFDPVATTAEPNPATGPFPTFTDGDAQVYTDSSATTVTGSLPNGTFITLACSSTGVYETAPDGYGGNSSWNQITSDGVSGWFPDAWTNNHAETSQAPGC